MEPSLTIAAIDLTNVYAAAGVLLVAVGAIWGIRKVISMFGNR